MSIQKFCTNERWSGECGADGSFLHTASYLKASFDNESTFLQKILRGILGLVVHPRDGILQAFGNFVYQDIQRAHFIGSSRNTEKFRVHIMRLYTLDIYPGLVLKIRPSRNYALRREGEVNVGYIILYFEWHHMSLRASFDNETTSLQKVDEKKIVRCRVSPPWQHLWSIWQLRLQGTLQWVSAELSI